MQTRKHITILNAAAANMVPDSYATENAQAAVLIITIVGTITVTIYNDILGDGTRVISLGAFTASAAKKLAFPVGKLQAVSSGAAPASSAVVDLFLVL